MLFAVTYASWFFHGCWVGLIPPVARVPVPLFILPMWNHLPGLCWFLGYMDE